MAKGTDIVGTMEEWFSKAPALPAGFGEGIAKIMPIIALIFGILGVLVGIAGFGVLTVLSPFAAMGGASVGDYGGGMIASVALLASSALLLAAFPGIKARKMSGWKLLFWSEVVHVIGSLIGMNIFGAIIGGLIGFYILFQIKSHYK